MRGGGCGVGDLAGIRVCYGRISWVCVIMTVRSRGKKTPRKTDLEEENGRKVDGFTLGPSTLVWRYSKNSLAGLSLSSNGRTRRMSYNKKRRECKCPTLVEDDLNGHVSR